MMSAPVTQHKGTEMRLTGCRKALDDLPFKPVKLFRVIQAVFTERIAVLTQDDFEGGVRQAAFAAPLAFCPSKSSIPG